MTLIQKGSTNITRYVVLRDSTDGTPETGFTITNLDLQYTRAGSAAAAKVDATALSTSADAHADNQAIEVDGTSSPGLYRIDWPDAAFASGVDFVLLCVSGTGIDPAIEEIQLVDFDPNDAVRLGLTALPNANADAAGGLPISDAGGLDLDNRMPAATAVTNLNTVFNTDFATNYDATNDRWKTDAVAISGSATAADKLELSCSVIVTGTVDNDVSPSSTVFEADDITEPTADHYIGRSIVFVTGNLAGQATAITDYALNASNGSFTVREMTEAPANDDTFIIV